MKKAVWAAAAALTAVIVVMWLRQGEYTRTEYMLNTVITISADDKAAVDDCFEEIRRIENLLSAYIPGSDVYNINSSAPGQAVSVSGETIELLERAAYFKKVTDGAFDISLKPVSDLWNISGGGYVPDEDELLSALKLKGDPVTDRENLTVTLPYPDMAVDLGGIAKGYAADKVTEILRNHQVNSALADLGGNITVIGKNGRRSWKIGLQHPEKARGNTFAYVEAEDKCIVTSGGYERYFERNGEKYHHIIDPSTGKNPENGVGAVTVIGEDAVTADALSTAFFVMGDEKSSAIAERLCVDAVFYTDNGVVTVGNVEITYTDE